MTDHERFDPSELAAAEALDADIDAALTGRAPRRGHPTLLWLSVALRPAPSTALARSVARARQRAWDRIWRPAQIAAAVLATLLFGNGTSSILNGAWVAENLGEGHSPHASFEGGAALIALSIAVAAGLLHRERLVVSVIAGVPVGIILGINGLGELDDAWGAALHLAEATAAIGLLVLWWQARRRLHPTAP